MSVSWLRQDHRLLIGRMKMFTQIIASISYKYGCSCIQIYLKFGNHHESEFQDATV